MTPPTLPAVAALYRYPVKGFGGQKLDTVDLAEGEAMPFDRAWAIENGPGRFDPQNPKPLPKISFLMLMRNERLAALETEFDEAEQTLVLSRSGRQVARGALNTQIGRQLIEQFIAGYMSGDLRGAPRIVHAPGHSFSDVGIKCVHIVNLASVRELERAIGKAVDPMRFRANIYIDAQEPWVEFGWVGETIRAGGVTFEVCDRTERCEATNVNPQTAERDMALPATLMRTYGHHDFGVYAIVSGGGKIAPGDELKIL